jgi:hypothetical protein
VSGENDGDCLHMIPALDLAGPVAGSPPPRIRRLRR